VATLIGQRRAKPQARCGVVMLWASGTRARRTRGFTPGPALSVEVEVADVYATVLTTALKEVPSVPSELAAVPSLPQVWRSSAPNT
jgi:hypothetical protein